MQVIILKSQKVINEITNHIFKKSKHLNWLDLNLIFFATFPKACLSISMLTISTHFTLFSTVYKYIIDAAQYMCQAHLIMLFVYFHCITDDAFRFRFASGYVVPARRVFCDIQFLWWKSMHRRAPTTPCNILF